MKQRFPLWRSLVFWGGMLVMTSIGAAWWDSRSHTASVANESYHMANFQSGIFLFRGHGLRSGWEANRLMESIIFSTVTPPPCLVSYEAEPQEDPELPPLDGPETMKNFLRASVWFHGPGSWALFIPHWLILLVVAVLWIGLLVWRVLHWRRWQRLVEERQAKITMEGVR